MVVYAIAVDKILHRGFEKRAEGVTDEEFNREKETGTVKIVAYEGNDTYSIWNMYGGPVYNPKGLTYNQIVGEGFIILLRYLSKDMCYSVRSEIFTPRFGYTKFIDEGNNVIKAINSKENEKLPKNLFYGVVDHYNDPRFK